ncbi:hypothetical protein [Sphingomonas immobilis]|uniref:Uncharacterized protein n=1 Tax=Sphingomonas immobilis TaxID=3063997 RepID=A0ABT8ZUC7_9SPHN|nr:hypothetical protein [Sphingomonas sp. CA1-15]MDO7841181.1 hypothetical protein [Sphingomonas sp. CA1-15]
MRRIVATLAIALLASGAHATDVSRTVAGWTLADAGGKPGDDGDRSLSIDRTTDAAEVRYTPNGRSPENGIVAVFVASFPGCTGGNTAMGVNFDGAAAREKAVRDTVHTVFAGYAKTCKLPADTEIGTMKGFTEAFAAVEKQLHDHPFTYPPEKDAE